MDAIGQFFGTLFGPIGTIFRYVFYLPIFNILNLLYLAIHTVLPTAAFPIAIVILTVMIRSALIPLTRRQLASTRRMQMLQPQLKALQTQYRSDPQRLMREQQALYKEHGVSMYGGCLPLLVQLPFLYALYGSFSTFFNKTSAAETLVQHLARVNSDLYPFVPHLTALPNTQFLWTNLAAPDPWHILPILAGILTFLQLRMAMPYRKPDPSVPVDAMTQSTRTTQYIMPFVTAFIGWSVPSGLALYWTISTAYSAIQQYFISGWGSLWVGIPGMEHLVKEQQLPNVTVKPAGTASLPSGSRVVDSRPPTASPPAGGIRGWFQQMREQARSMVDQQQQQREEAARAAAESRGNGNNGRQSAASNGANAARRQRQSSMRAAPTLVKANRPAAPSDADDADTGDTVDAAIAEATSTTTLPEQKIAAGTSTNGTNGTNGANGANGTNSTTKAPQATKAANGTARVVINGSGKAVVSSNGSGNGKASAATGAGSSKSGSGSGGKSTGSGANRANAQRKSGGKGGSGARPRGGRTKGGR